MHRRKQKYGVKNIATNKWCCNGTSKRYSTIDLNRAYQYREELQNRLGHKLWHGIRCEYEVKEMK